MNLFVHIHAMAALYMTGLIWFVQLVHYPLMKLIQPTEWPIYEQMHTRKTVLVTLPVMIVELVSLCIVAAFSIDPFSWHLSFFYACTAGVWVSTFGIQVPIHRKLEQAHDIRMIHRLINTNWIRTMAWTTKSIVLFISWAS